MLYMLRAATQPASEPAGVDAKDFILLADLV